MCGGKGPHHRGCPKFRERLPEGAIVLSDEAAEVLRAACRVRDFDVSAGGDIGVVLDELDEAVDRWRIARGRLAPLGSTIPEPLADIREMPERKAVPA